jgi:hypothetical protein
MASASTTTRHGHAAIGAIIGSMEPYLPPDYKGHRTTYNLINTIYQGTAAFSSPEVAYQELQKLQVELRRGLHDLYASKGIPPKLTKCLDQLKAALYHAIAVGEDAEFLKGITTEAKPEGKRESVWMVPESKYDKVKAALVEANKKIEKLKEENGSLTLYVRELEAQRAQSWGP